MPFRDDFWKKIVWLAMNWRAGDLERGREYDGICMEAAPSDRILHYLYGRNH